MPGPKLDPRDLINLLHPIALGRRASLSGRRGWDRLWRAPGPNARFFVATTFIWSVAMALTDPYKALYLSHLGLSNLAIGGFFALEMGLRAGGVLMGGLFAQRYGHKTTLLLFDFTSWTIPCLVLALASEPWHVYVATCLAATNALVSGSVVQFLVEDTDDERRTGVFTLFSLAFVLPMLLFPAAAGWAVERWGVEPVMRILFGAASAGTLWGVLWRRVRLKESASHMPQANVGEILDDALRSLKHLLAQPLIWPVLGSFLLVNAINNLNKAYYALYVTRGMGLPEALVGQGAALGSVTFVLSSLFWMPHLRVGKEAVLFVVLSLLSVVPNIGLTLFSSVAGVLFLNAFGGFFAGVHGPLLNERILALLPKGREGLSHAMLSSGMQVAVALSLALGGALFETRFGAFPWMMAGLAALQAALAWRMLRVPAVQPAQGRP